jgi:nicotinamide-nucleotide amidase
MIGEIIAIGDELTSGRILNTTSHFAASQLFAAGHEILAMATIGDDTELIGHTLQQALGRADFVVVTGGLGPTTDDMTNEAVASALDRPSTFYPEIFKKIQAHGKNNSTNHQIYLEKLAWLPEGAHALHTEVKSAGYFLVHDSKPVFFLPGVPHEMKELLLETVITRLAVWEGEDKVRKVRQRLFKVLGMAESEINRKLGHLEDRDPRVKIGYYPVFPEVHVNLTATGANQAEVDNLFEKFTKQIESVLGAFVYGSDTDTLEKIIGKILKQRGQTLAVAESCTGGLIGHTITRAPGSSEYFLGGVVSYSNALKERFLGVNRETLMEFGAVSAETARAMADGARRQTAADYAIAVTGIAGPDGGTEEKPVGTVYVGLATPEKVHNFLFNFLGNRSQIQRQACQAGLDLLRRRLLDYELRTV